MINPKRGIKYSLENFYRNGKKIVVQDLSYDLDNVRYRCSPDGKFFNSKVVSFVIDRLEDGRTTVEIGNKKNKFLLIYKPDKYEDTKNTSTSENSN